MNAIQELFLDMLRNPLLKIFLFSPTLWYLTRKLQIDIVSPYVQGYSDGEMLLVVGEKLYEQERLLTYELIRFYRTLKQEGLLTEKQLRRLEEDAFRPRVERRTSTTCIELPEVDLPGAHAPNKHLTVLITSFFSGPLPVPLPWELDPDFFEKHPKHNMVLGGINDREDEIDWYRQVWLAVVERFPW